MRILHIVWALSEANGILQAVTHLAAELRALQNDVFVVNAQQQATEIDGVQIIKSKAELERIIIRYHPDIAIINGIFFKEFVIAGKMLKRYKVPYLVTFHGSYSRSNYKKHTIRKALFRFLIFNQVIKHAANVIFLSQKERDNSIVKDCKKLPFIIPNGCNLPSLSRESKTNGLPIEFVFIGRMDIYGKGIDVLVEALDCVRHFYGQSELDKFHITLYGQHYQDSEIWVKKNIVESHLYPIDYKGPIYSNEKEEMLRRADILILPSRSEGFPVSVLEALSYGIPCIVTPQTNVADIIQQYKCGWVTELDAKAMANTIVSACNQYRDAEDALHKHARRAASMFTWYNIAKQTESCYKSIIKVYTD